MSFANSSLVKIPLSDPYKKYGKTFRVSDIYLTSSSKPQTLNKLKNSSDERSHFVQEFQNEYLNINWSVIDPRNDLIYSESSEIQKNPYISGFNVDIYENFQDATGDIGIQFGKKVASETGIKNNSFSYQITGEKNIRNYSIELTIVDFTGNTSKGLLTTRNPEPEFSVLLTGLEDGVFTCNYSGTTGENGQDTSNGLTGLGLYNFTGLYNSGFPDVSLSARSSINSDGFAGIELTPGVENYVMAVPFDAYNSGSVSQFLNFGTPELITYEPKLDNITGYRISGGDAFRYLFDTNYNTGSNLLTTCYGVTGNGKTSEPVFGYQGEIFLDSGIMHDPSYGYDITGSGYIFDNSLSLQNGFNTGLISERTVFTGLGSTGLESYGFGAGAEWGDYCPKYSSSTIEDSNVIIEGDKYNYGYFDSYDKKFKCLTEQEAKSGVLYVGKGIYSMPANDPNSYDIQYHSGENFNQSYELSSSYLNSIGRMPAVIVNNSQLNKIKNMDSAGGFVGLRRSNVGLITQAFSEKFSNESFLNNLDMESESTRDVEITNSTGGIEYSRLVINNVGENWCWTNGDGSHIYKYAGSGYEKSRDTFFSTAIKRYDGEVIFESGISASAPLMEIDDVTGLSGQLEILFEYHFKDDFFYQNPYGIEEIDNYNITSINLHTGSQYNFEISQDNLFKKYERDDRQRAENSIESIQTGISFKYGDHATPPTFYKFLPFDSIGSGIETNVNKIIAENQGLPEDTPINLIKDDQITIVNLDGMRAAGQNYMTVNFEFEHSQDPVITFGISYEGDASIMSYLGAMIIGHPNRKSASFVFSEVPPQDGFYLYIRSASGEIETREYNFTPWNPNYNSTIISLWFDGNDLSTITEENGKISRWNSKLGSSFLEQADENQRPVSSTVGQFNMVDFSSSTSINMDETLISQSAPTALVLLVDVNLLNGDEIFDFFDSHENSETKFTLTYNAVNNAFALRTKSGTDPAKQIIHIPTTDISNNRLIFTCVVDGLNSYLSINGDSEKNSGELEESGIILNGLNIGSSSANIRGLHGKIGELILFKDIISEEAIKKAEGYLAHKWIALDKLPSDHPYKTVYPEA